MMTIQAHDRFRTLPGQDGNTATPTSASDRPALLFVCSSGGHLAQLMTVEAWWSQYPRRWVTFDLPDARDRLVGEAFIAAHYPTTRHLGNLLRNFRLAIQVMRAERPDVVISTGAGVAVPFFVVARILDIPTIYIEVFDRMDNASLSGRVCSLLSSVFCVQLEEQRRLYPGAVLIGPML